MECVLIAVFITLAVFLLCALAMELGYTIRLSGCGQAGHFFINIQKMHSDENEKIPRAQSMPPVKKEPG